MHVKFNYAPYRTLLFAVGDYEILIEMILNVFTPTTPTGEYTAGLHRPLLIEYSIFLLLYICV